MVIFVMVVVVMVMVMVMLVRHATVFLTVLQSLWLPPLKDRASSARFLMVMIENALLGRG